LFYYEIYILRRVIFVFSAYYLSAYPWIQVILYLVLSKISVAYLLYTEPFDDPFVNKLEIFNELIVMIVGYH